MGAGNGRVSRCPVLRIATSAAARRYLLMVVATSQACMRREILCVSAKTRLPEGRGTFDRKFETASGEDIKELHLYRVHPQSIIRSNLPLRQPSHCSNGRTTADVALSHQWFREHNVN